MASLAASALALSLGLAAVASAAADGAPPEPASPANPATVTADALPTAQIDGVVWQQVVVGNTVYAAGSFGTARPAGSLAGNNTVVRRNILAYNLTTGELLPFAPVLNAQAFSIAASPDGSRIYVGGIFTTVNGEIRNRIAALNPTTGAIIHLLPTSRRQRPCDRAPRTRPSTSAGCSAVLNGATRSRAGAVSRGWRTVLRGRPSQHGGRVCALALSPGRQQGGHRRHLHDPERVHQPRLRAGAWTQSPAASLPWAANTQSATPDDNCAITELTATATTSTPPATVRPRRQPRRNSADELERQPDDWVEDCHGDTYAHILARRVYKVGHSHYCGNVRRATTRPNRGTSTAVSRSARPPPGPSSGTRSATPTGQDCPRPPCSIGSRP